VDQPVFEHIMRHPLQHGFDVFSQEPKSAFSLFGVKQLAPHRPTLTGNEFWQSAAL